MFHKFISTKNRAMVMLVMASAMLAGPAFGQDATVGGIAERITGQLGAFADLLTGAMFLVGIGLGALAALKFKAHNEDPRNTKITTPIVLAVVSACLIALPAYLTFMANSVVGEGAEGNSLDGNVYDQIGR